MEYSGAVLADRGMTVEREQDVALFTELTDKPFGLTALYTNTHTKNTHTRTEDKEF